MKLKNVNFKNRNKVELILSTTFLTEPEIKSVKVDSVIKVDYPKLIGNVRVVNTEPYYFLVTDVHYLKGGKKAIITAQEYGEDKLSSDLNYTRNTCDTTHSIAETLYSRNFELVTDDQITRMLSRQSGYC